jgi:2,4-dienoyl-CoA reductase-like NADH-dependent reductase (Old Yellow Enzyme family)
MRVLEPIKIGPVEIPNRVVRTAHGTHFGNGSITKELIDYHVERARGGVGLTILEIAGVHPSCPASICNFDDSIVEGYERLMAAIRPHGMKVFQQLWHAGHNGLPLDGGPPWSSCDLPSPVLGIVPIPMSKAQIDEIVAAFGAAAGRCKRGGVDGVELHASHGYLPQQFMSAMLNRREDHYGGSFENRMRFTVEVLGAIREEVGPDYPVGVRLSPEIVDGGMTPEETARAARYLEEAGLIDFLDVSMGGYFAFPKMIGGMFEPAGYELATSAPVTAAVSVPRL